MTGFCKSCNVKHFRLLLVSVYSSQSGEHLFQQLFSQCKGKDALLAAVPGSNTYNLQVLAKCLNGMRKANLHSLTPFTLQTADHMQMAHVQILTPIHGGVKDVHRHLSAIWLHKCMNPHL